MKKTYLERGFTLIELLVVIAIIGILSSVVLASLNTARSKGTDAAIKSNLASIRPQAEILYDTVGNYGTVAYPASTCATTAGTLFADNTIRDQITAAAKAFVGSAGTMANANCVSSITGTGAWAVSLGIKNPTTAGNLWCVDSTGTSREVVPAGAPSDRGFNGSVCK